MKYSVDVNESLWRARGYVLEGGEQILSGQLDVSHSISPSTGATALATLALLVLGSGFEKYHQLGVKWLWQNYSYQYIIWQEIRKWQQKDMLCNP